MPRIEGQGYTVDVEWDKDGTPVLYILGKGRVTSPKQALDVIDMAVKMTNEGPHQHVCSVYSMLEVTQVPFLGRFISSGRFPSTIRTAHIILGTQNQALRLVGSLAAVATSKTPAARHRGPLRPSRPRTAAARSRARRGRWRD